MKRSYAIILALALIFAAALTCLGVYGYRNGIIISRGAGGGTESEKENQEIAADIEDSAEPADTDSEGSDLGTDTSPAEDEVVPFTYIAEKDGVLYTSESVSRRMAIEGAEIIPIDSELFAILGEDVYYVTEGDEEYAPELRRCGTDGNNDVSITEFVSPIGSPAYVNGGIYSAYYTEADGGLNNGIYRYDIGTGETKKAIEGEYVIFGYDKDHIYYDNIESSVSGTELFRMDYDGDDQTQILSFSVPTDSIVIDKNYVFFSAFDDATQSYRLYRSPKDGKGNIDLYAFLCMSNRFDVIDGRIYYQADRAIYSARISGSNESRLAELEQGSQYAYNFLSRGGRLFFTEHAESDRYFQYDEPSGEKTEITK